MKSRPREVRAEVGPTEVGDVDLQIAHDAADAPLGVEHHERPSEAIGERASQPEGSRRHGQVEVFRRPAEERVAHRPAHHPAVARRPEERVDGTQHLAHARGERLDGNVTRPGRRVSHSALTTQRPGRPAIATGEDTAPRCASRATAESTSARGTEKSRESSAGDEKTAPRR